MRSSISIVSAVGFGSELAEDTDGFTSALFASNARERSLISFQTEVPVGFDAKGLSKKQAGSCALQEGGPLQKRGNF